MRRGAVAELAAELGAQAPPRGELALVLGPPVRAAPEEAEVEGALRVALEHMPLKQAAAHVARELELGKRDVYQLGLRLKSKDRGQP